MAISLPIQSEETSNDNPYGYLIGTEIVEANLKPGKYIGGSRRVNGRHEMTLDLILSAEFSNENSSLGQLVTASRDYDSQTSMIRKTTYRLVCNNPNAKSPRTRMWRIGGYEGPVCLTDGAEYHSLIAKLKTKDFTDQFAKAL